LNALGTHLLLELGDCNPKLLNDLEYVKKIMISAAEAIGAKIVGQSFHKFSPQGVTGVLAIAESHLSIHTWPEYSYAAADLFTCGNDIDPKIAANILIEKLDSKKPEQRIIRRGIKSLPLIHRV